MKVRVISFYTSPEYQAYADRLAASCRKFGLDYSIVPMPDLGSWHANVCLKPAVIHGAFKTFPNSAIFWTDADSEFKRAPDWGVMQYTDVAAHFFQRSPALDEEMLTGSMFFVNTPLVQDFVSEWARLTRTFEMNDRPELLGWNQAMQKMAYSLDYDCYVEVQRLGPEWCFIFDDMRELYPDCQPIVEHYQASRTLNRDGLRREQR